MAEQQNIPTQAELCRILEDIAGYTILDKELVTHPTFFRNITTLLHLLQMHVPGLEAAPNPKEAQEWATATASSLTDRYPLAVSFAFRGLSYSPHDANLWFLCGKACVDAGALDLGVTLMHHALWINPGHDEIRHHVLMLNDQFDEDRAADS